MHTNRKKSIFVNFVFYTVDTLKGQVCDISRLTYNRKGLILLLGCILVFSPSAEAQCAMCRAVLESEGNRSTAEGINNGIVYLMAIPYVLVGVLFYFVYRKMKG